MSKKWMIIGGIVFLFLLSYLPFPSLYFGPKIGVITINEAIMESEEIEELIQDTDLMNSMFNINSTIDPTFTDKFK